MVKSGRTNLVLSRKAGESIDLGNDIRITVEKVLGNKVSISIQSPKELTILRTEILRRFRDGAGEESKGRI